MQHLQILRGSSSDLNNNTLAEGEIAYCFDTRQMFIGDGQSNVLLSDADAMERLIAGYSQLLNFTKRLSEEVAELRRQIGDITSGVIGGSTNAVTLSGYNIDQFALLDDDDEDVIS